MSTAEFGDILLRIATSREFAGIWLWAVVAMFLQAFPGATGNAKYWFTVFMGFVIPPAAMFARWWLGYDAALNIQNLAASVGVGLAVAMSVKRGTDQLQEKMLPKMQDHVANLQANRYAKAVAGSGYPSDVPQDGRELPINGGVAPDPVQDTVTAELTPDEWMFLNDHLNRQKTQAAEVEGKGQVTVTPAIPTTSTTQLP